MPSLISRQDRGDCCFHVQEIDGAYPILRLVGRFGLAAGKGLMWVRQSQETRPGLFEFAGYGEGRPRMGIGMAVGVSC